MEKYEKVFRKFMKALMKKDVIGMWKNSQKTWKFNNNKAKLRLYLNIRVDDYEILKIEALTESVKKFHIKAKQNGVFNEANVMVICETQPYKPSPNGTWGVNPISIIKDIEMNDPQLSRKERQILRKV